MRVHSAGDTRDREPWSFGPEWEAICKKFIELRYKLLPYIYTAFWQQHKFGDPILRPVALLEQHIHKNLLREDEFAFGDHILVSPVLHPGQTSKMVYLPEGSWYYYFNNKQYSGGVEQQIDTPQVEMPIFMRGGSIIPEYPVMQHTSEIKIEQLTLTLYYAAGRFDSYLYDDEGETFAYEDQMYSFKQFIVEADKQSVKISQLTEGHHKPGYKSYKLYLVGLPFALSTVKIDGVQTEIEKDARGNYISIDSTFKKIIGQL